jgi:hypothetical protein
MAQWRWRHRNRNGVISGGIENGSESIGESSAGEIINVARRQWRGGVMSKRKRRLAAYQYHQSGVINGENKMLQWRENGENVRGAVAKGGGGVWPQNEKKKPAEMAGYGSVISRKSGETQPEEISMASCNQYCGVS